MTAPPVGRLPSPALLIASERLADATGGTGAHIYAATGATTHEVPLAGVREIDQAVDAASAARAAWRDLGSRGRARSLQAFGAAIRRDADRLAAIQTIESSTPCQFAQGLPAMAAEHLEYAAGWADKIGGELLPAESGFGWVVDEPYGVVGAIVTWNAALVATSQVIAPILAAGNTVVLKPPVLAPFTAIRLGELALEAGLPPGVVNVVTGDAVAGERLVRHPTVAKVHFTGSRETARRIIAAAADTIVPLCLELGGKSPLIICADADLLGAAQLALSALAGLSGQGCALPTRVLVERSVHDRVLTLIKGLVRRIAVGDPLDPRTQMGPLISAAACARVLETIDQAVREQHGRLVAGGQRLPAPLGDGYFIAPTLFADVAPESALAREEIFGPVLSIMAFDRDDEAIALANATPYGLAAYVFTADFARARRFAGGIDAGLAWINGMGTLGPSMPFGGYRQSGYGRLGGRAGIREFSRQKTVCFPPAGLPTL